MDEKLNISDEPNLSLSFKTPMEYESGNRISTLEEAMSCELKNGQVDPNVNLKKLRRTISNRLSSQRSRMRKAEYIAELKKEAKDLQDTIALVGQNIEIEKDNKKKLQLENEMLQVQLDSVTDKSNLLTVQTEELKVELKRLKELAKAQEDEEHMDMDQSLNFDTMNFSPPKNDDL